LFRKLFTPKKKRKIESPSFPSLTGIERQAIDSLPASLLSLRSEMSDREFQLRTQDIDYDNVARLEKAIDDAYRRG